MKPLTLPKSSLLKKPWEYKKVYNSGKRIRGENLTIIHLPNDLGENRLGISIHGVKRASCRNRIKRIIREFFRLNRAFMTPASDIVFAVRKDFKPDSPDEIKDLIERMLKVKNL